MPFYNDPIIMTSFRLLAPALVLLFAPILSAQRPSSNTTLTAVRGITVGHVTLDTRPTGCTVILAGPGATAAVDVRGAAPATRETDLLDPVNSVQAAHAIVISGGSAFGLDTASGVMRWLEARNIGVPFAGAHVPIVPAAALFDLNVGDGSIRPDADCGYRAADAASANPVALGSVGAGAGATVGKAAGLDRAMKGGIGSWARTLPSGLTVSALVAVNAFGDIIDPATGQIIAGARNANGRPGFADARTLLRDGRLQFTAAQHTTIGVVATNARLTKTEAQRIAQMAHDGFARTITPSHTPVDGDAIFVLATGERPVGDDAGVIGALAADVLADAVVRGVEAALPVPGYPAVRDLFR